MTTYVEISSETRPSPSSLIAAELTAGVARKRMVLTADAGNGVVTTLNPGS